MKLFDTLVIHTKVTKMKLNDLRANKRKLKHFHVTYVEGNETVSKIFTERERITVFIVLKMRGAIILNVIELTDQEHLKYIEHIAPWAVKK